MTEIQGKSILVRVSARFELARVRVIASRLYFTSAVTYKKYNRLVYTPPDLLARFCKVNLPKAKNWPDLFSRPNLL